MAQYHRDAGREKSRADCDEEQLLVQKLNFLRLESTKLSDAAQRFQLQKQMEEAEESLKAIRNENLIGLEM